MRELLEILEALHSEGKNFCLQSQVSHGFYNLSIKYKKISVQTSSSDLGILTDFARLHLASEVIAEDNDEDFL